MGNAEQQGPLAFKRVYVDIPPATHAALAATAKARGMSAKALLAELINRECGAATASSKQQRKRGK